MNLTAEWIKGSVYGSFFFIGFGSWWMWNGWADNQPMPAIRGVLLACLAAALLLTGFALLRRVNRMPSAPRDASRRKRMMRAFGVVNLIQWVAIFGASFLLGALHRPMYIAPAIALIVGLHFFPLARLFGNPLHYATGGLLLLWTAGCLLLLPQDRLSAMTCVGCGVILLLSAAATLLIGHKACGSLNVTASPAGA